VNEEIDWQWGTQTNNSVKMCSLDEGGGMQKKATRCSADGVADLEGREREREREREK